MIIINSMYDLTLFTLPVAHPSGHLFPWIHRGKKSNMKDKTLISRMHETEENIFTNGTFVNENWFNIHIIHSS